MKIFHNLTTRFPEYFTRRVVLISFIIMLLFTGQFLSAYPHYVEEGLFTLHKVLEVETSGNTFTAYGNIELSVQSHDMEVYVKKYGTSDSTYRLIISKNQSFFVVNHEDWLDREVYPNTHNFQCKFLYYSQSILVDTKFYQVIVKDTIPDLLDANLIEEENLNNCYRKNDDGPIIDVPKEYQLKTWYLWESWLEYFNLAANEDVKWDVADHDPNLGDIRLGTAYVFYGFEGGNKHDQLTRPIIFSEGIDLQNTLRWRVLLYKVFHCFGMWRALLDHGYDIVYINFEDGLKGIDENADVLKRAIEQINSEKWDNRTSAPQNIVIGASLGGLTCRYALKTMETQGYTTELTRRGITKYTDHDTSLFVCFDSPQQGANLPLSIQLVIEDLYHWLSTNEKIEDFRNMIHAPAPKMLLTNHVKAFLDDQYNGNYPSYPATKRIRFLNNLEALRTIEDDYSVYPRNCRIIGASNGSGNGQKQTYKNVEMDKGTSLFKSDIATTQYFGYAIGDDLILQIAHTITYIEEFRGGNIIPFDSCPGSYENFIKMFTDSINDVGIGASAKYEFPYAAYIPTISALDLWYQQGIPLYINQDLREVPHILDKTPFYDLKWEAENHQHIYVSYETTNYIFKYIYESRLAEQKKQLGDRDVDQDSVITQNDIDLIHNYIFGDLTESLNPIQLLRGDVNNDGYLSVHDITIIENGIQCNVAINDRKAVKYIIGDLNNDLLINSDDLACMNDLWNEEGEILILTNLEQVLADVNGDCVFNQADITGLVNYMITGYLPYQICNISLGIPRTSRKIDYIP
ncbi:MAG: hypothetical protein JXJ04_26130 [Spirochaetales bacterium]|nr:hypothetical protein [Spirochaetales bacterium]